MPLIKLLFWILGSAIIIPATFIPEAVMYFLYQLIAPQSDLARVLVLLVFWVTGFGVSVAFLLLGIFAFCSLTVTCLE